MHILTGQPSFCHPANSVKAQNPRQNPNLELLNTPQLDPLLKDILGLVFC